MKSSENADPFANVPVRMPPASSMVPKSWLKSDAANTLIVVVSELRINEPARFTR